MPEESYSFAQARVRLEEIVAQVRKKDVSLEKSLDLLEEGVRLANQCTELIDHADWETAGATQEPVADALEDDVGVEDGDGGVRAESADSEGSADGALADDAPAEDADSDTSAAGTE